MLDKKELNKEQQEAISFVDGNLLIIASAGTGKTTTIVERFVHLLKDKGFRADEILMTTFTNKAAKDMMRKIHARTGLEPPYVGTMHSLLLKILRTHARLVVQNEHFSIIDEPDKKKLVKKILQETNLDARADHVKYFLLWIGKFKNRAVYAEILSEEMTLDDNKTSGLIEDVLDDEIIEYDPAMRKYVNKVYKKYEEHLRKNNLIDLDDILLLTLKLFEKHPEILAFYSNKFKSIMVDEAQDLNIVQIRILNLLQRNNLCLIGDDCQNIYEWRGSSNDMVFDFNEHHDRVFLKDNYRSGKNIIQAVNKVIASMSFKIDKELVCTKPFTGHVNIQVYTRAEDEIASIVSQVQTLLRQNVAKEDIAVLFRTNRIGKAIEREFRRNKIPCHLSKSKDFFEREEIKDVLSFLRLQLNPLSIVDFERLIELVDGIGKIKVKRFEALARQRGCTFIELFDHLEELNLTSDTVVQLARLKMALLDDRQNPFFVFFNEYGYLEYLKKKYRDEPEKLHDKRENLGVFSDLYEPDEKITDQKENLRAFLDGLIDLEKKEKTRDKVTLSTIHSAKGLEWEYVFLASCNEKTLPFYTMGLEKLKRDSELRLFYVAISRAKKGLTISHYYQSDWGKEIARSQFLDIIDLENRYNFGL